MDSCNILRSGRIPTALLINAKKCEPSRDELQKKPKFTQVKYGKEEPLREYNLPEEVVEHILRLSQDVQLAKTCRLVSKLWNRASCRFLRENACVLISENMDMNILGLLQNLLNTCSERAKDLNELPNPFRDVHLVLQGLGFTPWLEFIMLHNLNITTLTGPQYLYPLSFGRLPMLLKSMQTTLTHLQLTFPNTLGIPEVLPDTTFHLHNLKYLDFEISESYSGTNITDGECQFLDNILQYSSPEHIKLHLAPTGSFTKLCGDVFTWKSNLKVLQLSGTMYEEDLKAIGRMSPSVALKDFTLDWRRRVFDLENEDERQHGLVVPFLQKVRCQLNRLEISSYALMRANFEFPNLKELRIVREIGNVTSYLPDNFPKLETFGFDGNCSHGVEDFNSNFKHEKISRLNIDFGSKVVFSAYHLKRCQVALKRLSDQLPNINTLSVQIGKIYSVNHHSGEILYLLAHNFPHIKNLRVGKWCDDGLLIGTKLSSHSLDYALGIRKNREDSCQSSNLVVKGEHFFSVGVTQFQDLEVLRWNSSEDYQPGSEHHRIFRLVPRQTDERIISSNLWKEGLAKLPKLRTLILQNCPRFQIQDESQFRRCLPHLQVVME